AGSHASCKRVRGAPPPAPSTLLAIAPHRAGGSVKNSACVLLHLLTAASGTKRIFPSRRSVSASGGKADIQCPDRVFPLLTQSGHEWPRFAATALGRHHDLAADNTGLKDAGRFISAHY